jgi:hypothetical protein
MAVLDLQTKHFIEDIPRIMFAKFPQMVESVQKKVRKKCKTDEHKAMTITNTKLFWSSQYENKNSLQLLLIFTTNCINVQWNVLYMVKVLD